METSATNESVKCCLLAAAMRIDATRATMPGFANKLIRGAEDLEQLAERLLEGDGGLPTRHH